MSTSSAPARPGRTPSAAIIGVPRTPDELRMATEAMTHALHLDRADDGATPRQHHPALMLAGLAGPLWMDPRIDLVDPKAHSDLVRNVPQPDIGAAAREAMRMLEGGGGGAPTLAHRIAAVRAARAREGTVGIL